MITLRDTLETTAASMRAYRMRVLLTMLGVAMGVATIITVMTLIQGANLYVEQKIANLGTNVFEISRVPLVVADFNAIMKALKNKKLTLDDSRAVAAHCGSCEHIGAVANVVTRTRYGNRDLTDTSLIGQTQNMVNVDTRTIETGRYFTETEEARAATVCVIGAKIREELIPGGDPLGAVIRLGHLEFTVIGVYEKIGSVLGMEQDNFAIIPMSTFRKLRGSNFSVVLQVKARPGANAFEMAQDEARAALRAHRHVAPSADDGFFIGTAGSYIDLWKSISAAFFAVFLMVSAISAVVGGIVIMNVMLVSVTERTKEIGIRRALGATQSDILRQFLSEGLVQCLIGGAVGIFGGFLLAVIIRAFASFPTSVQASVALFGFVLSAGIGLFFGIYPATRAARLDPIEALRRE